MDLSRNNLYLLLLQLNKFGIVDLLAMAVHVGLFTLFVETEIARPMVANILCFIPAFVLSFYSHFAWTFQYRQHGGQHHIIRTILKFLGVALFGFALNSLGIFIVTDIMQAKYYLSIIILLFFTPTVLFLLNNFFCFQIVSDKKKETP
jgi:putative flippase GtrA